MIALARFALVAGAIGLLELLCRSGVISRLTMIPPSEMAVALAALLASGRYTSDILFTAGNVGFGVALAVGGGFLCGLALHGLPRLRSVVAPLLAAFYAVPTFVFYPLLIVLLGLGRAPLVAIAALSGIVGMIVNTLDGLDRIPPVYVKTARANRMGPVAAALLIRLPAATPHLVTGLKLAISYSIIGAIAGEFILAVAGVGRQIAFAYNNLDNRTMYALLLGLLAAVTIVNVAIHEWERRTRRRWGALP